MPLLLKDRAALITGGSRGLGLAIVKRLASEGASGCALDLSWPADVALPAGFAAITGDVGIETSLQAAIASLVNVHGQIDIVVANAGLVPVWRETENLDMAEWDRVMAVNVRGVATTIKHAARAMKGKGGAIVVMASINAFLAHPRQMLYTASKHAVLGIVRSAARDLGRWGIRVNAIAPGPIATDALLDRIRTRAQEGGMTEDKAIAALAAETALGRLATADEVAKAVLFLASDLASGVSGECLPVDAGLA